MKIFLPNEAATLNLGATIAKQFSGTDQGGIVLLNGDLGAGKTTFVRGVLNAYGYHGTVKSPTYTLVEPYLINNKEIYHFDLYRLGDPEEIEYVGGRDYFHDKALCLIEWPEKAAGFLPKENVSIHLSYKSDGRQATVENY
jgi:tRNA threonylcarbamoyladenosine biosynthesis protein TsaE